MTQVCHLIRRVFKRTAICCRSSCKWFLPVRPLATVYFTFLACQCCHGVKETAVTMALNIREKTPRLNKLAKHRNQVCKTRHHEKSASLKLVQLAPRSFCHAADGIWWQPLKSNFCRGELRKTSSRSAAPSALVSLSKHLECSKGDGGDKKHGNLLLLLLQMTWVSPTICNCVFHIFGLSMLSNVVKETAVTM